MCNCIIYILGDGTRNLCQELQHYVPEEVGERTNCPSDRQTDITVKTTNHKWKNQNDATSSFYVCTVLIMFI